MATGFPFECECGNMFVFTNPVRLADPSVAISVKCPFCGRRRWAFELYERTILSARQFGVWALMSDLMEAGRVILDVGQLYHVDLTLPFHEAYAESMKLEAMAGNLAAGLMAVSVTNHGFDIASWYAPGIGREASQVDLRWYAFGRSNDFEPEVWRQYLHMALIRRERGEATMQLVLAMIAWESWMNWAMWNHLHNKAGTERERDDLRTRLRQMHFHEKMQFITDSLSERLRQAFNEEACRGRLQAGKNLRNDIVHGWVEQASTERADDTLSGVLRALYLVGSPLMQPIRTRTQGQE